MKISSQPDVKAFKSAMLLRSLVSKGKEAKVGGVHVEIFRQEYPSSFLNISQTVDREGTSVSGKVC